MHGADQSSVLSTDGEYVRLSLVSVSARVSGTGDEAMPEMSGTMPRVSRIPSQVYHCRNSISTSDSSGARTASSFDMVGEGPVT